MPTDAYTFVSLVGRNRMGIMQPFLACRQHMGLPQAVHLLVTPSMQGYGSDLVRLLAEFGMGAESIFLHEIGEFVPPQAQGAAPATTAAPAASAAPALVAQLCSQGPLVWNLNGGTGASQTACLLALQGEGHRLVQTTHNGFYISSLNKKEQDVRLPLPAPLPVAELLHLHGIAVQPRPEAANTLQALVATAKIRLPENALFSVEHEGFLFDAVWNAGDNVLRFLLCWESNVPEATSPHTGLSKSRALLEYCLSKAKLGGMYDREVLVMGKPGIHMERLFKEGGDKIHTLVLMNREKDAKYKLAPHLAPAVTTPEKAGSLPRVALQEGAEQTLVMFLPPDPSAVLVALATHRPRRLVLCHTTDEGVQEGVALLQAASAALQEEYGLGTVEFVESTYEAQDIRRRLPALGPNVQVNCTPGTKSQGAHLALWAKERGAEVWVLDQRSVTACRVDAPAPALALQQPSLRTMLRLCVKAHVDDYGWGKQSEGWSDPWYAAMLACMQQTVAQGPASFEANAVREAQWKQRTSEAIGERFEKLTAHAIAAINPQVEVAQGVNCIRKPRPGEVYVPDKHRLTERDVLATYGGFLFMVSCKARTLSAEECKATWAEAKAVAGTLGRFVVPVLCCLDAPQGVEEEVRMIDWNTLCQPKALGGWLVRAAKQHVRQ